MLNKNGAYFWDSTQKIALEIFQGRTDAHEKHGDNSIEAKDGDDFGFWLPCLIEEVGEAASELTYDKGGEGRLRAELIDVITVATAWVAAIDREKES
jgi:NTP pyrophosphatase (non-canonical NTP hydrolase)